MPSQGHGEVAELAGVEVLTGDLSREHAGSTWTEFVGRLVGPAEVEICWPPEAPSAPLRLGGWRAVAVARPTEFLRVAAAPHPDDASGWLVVQLRRRRVGADWVASTDGAPHRLVPSREERRRYLRLSWPPGQRVAAHVVLKNVGALPWRNVAGDSSLVLFVPYKEAPGGWVATAGPRELVPDLAAGGSLLVPLEGGSVEVATGRAVLMALDLATPTTPTPTPTRL